MSALARAYQATLTESMARHRLKHRGSFPLVHDRVIHDGVEVACTTSCKRCGQALAHARLNPAEVAA